ncbi:hypothetical protein [Micropruina sp.]|uniref:hypothetical protein n=1 Tax=Micropruina sp. TaxID=2737536 RepID=UPI0039E5F327
MEIEPVTVEQARRARLAFERYGRGRGSLARLNFGDCFASTKRDQRNPLVERVETPCQRRIPRKVSTSSTNDDQRLLNEA